jgi:hypothetical protein
VEGEGRSAEERAEREVLAADRERRNIYIYIYFKGAITLNWAKHFFLDASMAASIFIGRN